MMDSSFWATVALVLFLALIAYVGVPRMVGRTLDSRAERIRNELEEARKLREDAQQLLAEYQRKRKEAEREANDIVAAAKRDAESIVADARRSTQDYVERRNALAEQKIAQAERDAVAEVRGQAVDIAIAAAARLLADKVDGKADAVLFDASLQEMKSRLN